MNLSELLLLVLLLNTIITITTNTIFTIIIIISSSRSSISIKSIVVFVLSLYRQVVKLKALSETHIHVYGKPLYIYVIFALL